ncbi:hypothetical protein ACFL6S_24950 [Candidatus Poribacteria bacterium]
MEDVLMPEALYEGNGEEIPRVEAEVVKMELLGNAAIAAEEKSKLVVLTALAALAEIAAVAIIQLVGVYGYGVNFLEMVTERVGWSTYSSGLGVGFALLLAGVAFYAHVQRIDIGGWPGFSSGLSKLCAAMLVLTPLLGQVNTYTAMCNGLGAGLENASLVGAKISEALVSTICGYGAFSILLVVYMFAIKGKGEDNEGA